VDFAAVRNTSPLGYSDRAVREQEREQIEAGATSPDTELAASASSALDLLQRARNSEGDERFQLAGRLNTLLRAAPPADEREARAQFLLEKLDDEAFHDLYDGDGSSVRAVAVEALLALGFPWALHLDPDDLDYLRAVKPQRTTASGWRAMAVVTGVLAALFALAFFIHL
jgi:hypothetical protein